jgi:hypothetical protein
MSSRNYRNKDSTALGETSNRDDKNDNAEFAPSNGRSCNENYCKGNRAIFKAAVFNFANPSLKNRWRIKGYLGFIFNIKFL